MAASVEELTECGPGLRSAACPKQRTLPIKFVILVFFFSVVLPSQTQIMAKKQSKSATKATGTKPATTVEILAKAKKAPVEVCLEIISYLPLC